MKRNRLFEAGAIESIRVLTLIFATFLVCAPLFSQGSAGTITGTVTDQSGGVIAGATVTIVDVQRGISRPLTADDAGAYHAPNLLPGTYTVKAEAKGFKSVERSNILLQVGSEIRVDVTLQPGEQSQMITVTEQAPLVETTNATLGGALSNETINELPLNGRNYQNLLSLRPGVTIYPGGGGWTQSTNGIRPEDNVYLVDGVNDNEPFSGMSVLNGAPIAGDASTNIPIDAIQEFNTQQNPKAEYGWKPGAIVNVGLKSGTNNLHGTAYAFGRDGAWDARNYFNTAPSPKTPVGLEQFGATGGGRIIKDKLFYFVGYEGQRYNVGSTYVDASPSLIYVPGAATDVSIPSTLESMVAGGASVGNGISALSMNLAGCPSTLPAAGSPLWSSYQCTGKDLAGNLQAQIFPVNLTSSNTVIPALASSNTQNNGLAKIDYHINDHHSLNGMYFFGQNDGTWNDAGNELEPQWRAVIHTRAQVASGSYVWSPNSNWVNEARVGFDHLFQPTSSADSNVNPATGYGINTGITDPFYFGMPMIRIASLGFGSFLLGENLLKQQGPDDVFQVLDHISYLHGNHAIKFGGEIIYNKGTDAGFATARGRIDFSTLQDFLAGTVNKGQLLSGNPLRTISNEGYALFVQDDWRIKPRLMLNLGVRYELTTVLKEANDQLGNFLPGVGLVQVGKQIPSIYNGDHNNFAPRIGLAWDVQGNGKTVVRAGASVMYEQMSYNVFTAQSNTLGLGSVPTGAILSGANGVIIPSPGNIAVNTVVSHNTSINWNGSSVGGASIFPTGQVQCGDGVGSDPQPCSTLAVNPNLRTPYVTTWTLGIQRAITNNLSVDASYVGNHGTKLLGFTDLNQPTTSGGPLPYATKFPYLSNIDQLSNLYESNYNGLQATLTQRAMHGLSYVVGYTYSHALDDNSHNWGGGMPLNSYDIPLQYASSDFDIRHRFTMSITYDIPAMQAPAQLLKGWELNSVITLQTGQPWGPQDFSDDFSGTGEVNNPLTNGEWWNFTGNPADFTSNQHPFAYCNGDASGLVNCIDPFGNQVSSATAATMWNKCTAAMPVGSAAYTNMLGLGVPACYVAGNSVLTPPAPGTYGNSGRNPFRDAGFRNWDMSVIKAFKFRERVTAQFRAEFFNILNHPTFANPYGSSNGFLNNDPSAPSNFGCGCATPDTAASNPVLGSGANRAIQLGLKILF